MNKLDLSIIIPCYNCAKTLTEAVASVPAAGDGLNYEIILIDDGSTDNTLEIINDLAQQYANLKFFRHKKNLGGGATRNTGIKNAASDLIFCLDSDDLLTKGVFKKMIDYQKIKNCDGVGVSKSIKFKGQNTNNISYINYFGYVDKKIPFDSLFEKNTCALYSTFLMTKNAFEICNGYPTDHGFDTQGLAFRFLANGLTAYTCPETTYLHRVDFHKSYYLREFEQGKASHNWFKIFEEFLFLFNDQTKDELLNFNLNDPDKSLIDFINAKTDKFVCDYQNLLRPKIKKIYKQEILLKNSGTPFDYYWLGSEFYRQNDYQKAVEYLNGSLSGGLKSPHLYFKLYDSLGKINQDQPIEYQQKFSDLFAYHVHGSLLPVHQRIINKIKKWHEKYFKIIKIRWQSSENKLLFWHWILLRIKKLFKVDFYDRESAGPEKIDLVIPTISKDYQLLSLFLNSLKKNLNHQINKIYLVSNNNQEIVSFAKKHNCIFIDETTVLGYGKEKINYQVGDLDRRGWIFQQLLKLSGDKITETENYLIVDSDTMLLNKHSFLENGKFVFYQNEEWHEPYMESFRKIFGYKNKNKLSFTSHMMIFNNQLLKQMKQEIEQKYGQSWDKIYLSTISSLERSCISDYETYANWVLYHYPERVIQKPLYNKSFSRLYLDNLNNISKKYSRHLKSISFHSFIN